MNNYFFIFVGSHINWAPRFTFRPLCVYSATENLSDQETLGTTSVTVSRAEALQEEIVMYIVVKDNFPIIIHTHCNN